MAGAAPLSSVVQDLKEYLVPAEKTECGEYVYRMPLERKKYKTKKGNVKYKYDVEEDLKRIVSALLNTSGGIVQLHPKMPETNFREFEYEEFCKGFDDKLGFIPADIYHSCISLHFTNELICIFVHKSFDFITANAHLFTRESAENKQVKDFHFITQVINLQTTSRDDNLPLTGPFVYGEKCTETESQCREFKQYKTSDNTAEHLVEELDNDRFLRALFGMANLPGGGDIVIGVKEDPVTEGNYYIGHELTMSEEEIFNRKLEALLQQDADGNKRIWGDSGSEPKDGTHWSCKFIPLEMPAQPDTSQTRRVLIAIHIYHCPGGAFLRKPEAFTLNDDGYIEEVTFEEWQREHTTDLPTVSVPLVASAVKMENTPGIPATDKPGKKASTSGTVPKTPKQPAPLSKITKKSIFQPNTFISYTKHSSRWDESYNRKHPSEMVQHPEVSDLYKTGFPILYTPCREALQQILSNQSLSDLLSDIDRRAKEPGFGIAADSLWKCLKHFCTSLPQLPNHIMDVLTVTESAVLILKTVNTGVDTPHKAAQHNAYTVTLARILKRRILEAMSTVPRYPKMCVQVSLLNEDGTPKPTPQSYEQMYSDVHNSDYFQIICSSLSSTLKGVNTCFRDLVVRDEDLHLSAEQTRLLLDLDTNRFNVIEGPPGCGKTLIARKFSKSKSDKAAYVSSSDALVIRAKNSGFDAYCAKDSKQVADLFEHSLKEKQHIVIDDNHNYKYSKKQLHTMCSNIAASDRYLHVFQDSTYHNYLCTTNPDALGHFLHKHRREYGTVHMKTLNEIHRNTQVVGSFLKEQVQVLLPKNTKETVKNASAVKGDDVNVQQVKNLRVDGPDNGVLKHVEALLQTSVDPHHQHYTSIDVAILVDHKNPKEAEREKRFYQKLFQKYMTEKSFQDASEFPVRGTTIDRVDNYIGLESRVVICVMPRERRFSRGDQNTKYRIAIASRGIDRVDFLQEQKLDGQTALDMNIDQYPINGDGDKSARAPVRVWRRREGEMIRDVCWVSEGADTTLLYITEISVGRMSVTGGPVGRMSVTGRSVGRMSVTGGPVGRMSVTGGPVGRMSVMGNPLPLTLDTSHMNRPWSVTCTSDGERVVVTDRSDPGSWSVYVRQCPGVYSLQDTYTLDRTPFSARVTKKRRLAVLVYKGSQYYLRLYRGVADPVQLWEQSVDVWYTSPGFLSVTEDGSPLLCGLWGVKEYSAADGALTRTIPLPDDLRLPIAVCADPSGSVWVGGGNGSVWLSGRQTGGQKVITAGGDWVWSLALHGDKHLAVCTWRGLQLYDLQNYSRQ